MTTDSEAWQEDLEQLRGNRERLTQCAAKLQDPWVREKLNHLLHDNDACVHAFAQATLAAQTIPRLRRSRRAAQAAADRHARARPTGWRWWRRRAWEDEHERRRSRLRKLVREEQDVLCGVPSAVHTALAYRVRLLRKEVDAMEVMSVPKPAEVVIRDTAQVERDPEQLVKDVQRVLAEKKAARVGARQ